MDRESTFDRIMQTLKAEFDDRGRGSIARTERALKLRDGYFRKNRSARSFRLEKLAAYLEVMDVDPGSFFRRAFEDSDLAEAERQADTDPIASFLTEARSIPRGKAARLLNKVDSLRLHNSLQMLSEADRKLLDRLDDKRYEDHAACAAEAEKLCRRALERHHVKMVARALGIRASALRLGGQLNRAQLHLTSALRLARRHRLRDVEADLLQRVIYVVADRGEHQQALAIADRSLVLYEDLQDVAGIGKAQVDRGAMLFRLGDYEQAQEAYEVALRHLPEALPRYRWSALQSLACTHLATGRVDAADRRLEEAAPYRPAGGHHVGRLAWLRARIARERHDYATAERLYREALVIFADFPGDAVLASIELVRLYMVCGRIQDARQLARGMRALVFDLPDNNVLGAAAWQLARAEMLGGLTVELVDKVAKEIEGGRARRLSGTAVLGRG